MFSRRLICPLQPTSVCKILANPNGASGQLPSRPAPPPEPTRPRPRREAKGEPNTSAFYLFHHSPLEGLPQYRTSQWLLIPVSCSISFIVRRPRIERSLPQMNQMDQITRCYLTAIRWTKTNVF